MFLLSLEGGVRATLKLPKLVIKDEAALLCGKCPLLSLFLLYPERPKFFFEFGELWAHHFNLPFELKQALIVLEDHFLERFNLLFGLRVLYSS